MSAPNYEIEAGTIIGETRHEIYTKYGEYAFENTKYGWHHEHPHITASIAYNLVPVSGSCKFLTTGITYRMTDMRPTDPKTGKKPDGPEILAPDISSPSRIHFEWSDTDIPLADKDQLEKDGIAFTLPSASFGNEIYTLSSGSSQ